MPIYLDHAATTPLASQVLSSMQPFFIENYGNPTSYHSLGLNAKQAIYQSRADIAQGLKCDPSEIVFTGGGTEGINLAIKGIALAKKRGHIITSTIEHPAVLETCRYLARQGFEISFINVDKQGIINPKDIEQAIRPDTILVSIMYANNEIGTIQPISRIGKICRSRNIIFHTDACQAAGALDLNVNKLNVDLLTINGSKIYGPKGVGALYIKSGVHLTPLLHGGGQERGLRSGTENTASIVGLSTALSLAQKNQTRENQRLTKLRHQLITGIRNSIPKTILNGHPTKRLPNNANLTFVDIEGESIILHLNEQGIYASTGSACSSRTLEPSHVILALGQSPDVAHGSVRFTLGRDTTAAHIKTTLKALPPIISELRQISPLKLAVS